MIYKIKTNWPIKKLDEIKEKMTYIWRKEYLWFFGGIAFIGSLLLIIFKVKFNDFLVYNTLIVIFWYSRETMDLKRISNKQIEYLRKEHKTNLRPYLRLQKGGGKGLILVNEGKGVAVNLRPIYKDNRTTKELLKIPAMAASPNSFTESFIPSGFDLELDPSVAKFTIQVAYNDIEKRNYLAIFKSNILFNDGFEIIGQEEV